MWGVCGPTGVCLFRWVSELDARRIYRSLNAKLLLYYTEWCLERKSGEDSFSMFQRELVFPCPYAISFLSYCSNENHIQTAEEIKLIFAACWTLIHIKCEVMCRKMIMNLVSQEAGKIPQKKIKFDNRERKERKMEQERKGDSEKEVEIWSIKISPESPDHSFPRVEIGARGCASGCKPWLSFSSL